MTWTLLSLAILFEVAGTVALKLSDGLSRLGPSLIVVPAYGISFALLAVVLKSMPLSVAYAVWAAAGTALVAMVGFVWFREPVTALKMVSLALVVAGVVGLHLSERLVDKI